MTVTPSDPAMADQEQDARLARLMTQYPDDAQPAIEHAMAAWNRKDFAAAHTRWALVNARFPDLPEGYIRHAEALLSLGRYDEAEQVTTRAMELFPNRPFITMTHASVARRRGDWAEALRRWQAAIEAFPDFEQARTGLGETRMAVELARLDGNRLSLRHEDIGPITQATRAVMASAGVTDWPEPAFFMGFEALGDNCAFGGLQRIFGAEPLGLLRWANVGQADLVFMLLNRFEGVSDPEHTFIEINPETNEYYGGDRRYFKMHTFMQTHDVSGERMLKLMMQRLRLLRDKLIEDLEAGEKIFVFTRAESEITPGEIRALHRAIKRYGNPPLLIIRRTAEPAENGRLETWADGLMVGDIFELPYDPMQIHPVSATWLEICRAARRLVPLPGTDA